MKIKSFLTNNFEKTFFWRLSSVFAVILPFWIKNRSKITERHLHLRSAICQNPEQNTIRVPYPGTIFRVRSVPLCPGQAWSVDIFLKKKNPFSSETKCDLDLLKILCTFFITFTRSDVSNFYAQGLKLISRFQN